MPKKINIASLTIDTADVIKESVRLKTELDNVRASQKKLTASGKGSSEGFIQNEIKIKELSKAYRDNQNFATSLSSSNKDLSKTMEIEGKSTQELRNSRAKLNQISKNIKGNTKEEIERRTELNTVIDKQSKAIKEQSPGYIKLKENVGNYEGAIAKVSPQMAKIITLLRSSKQGLVARKIAMQASTAAIKEQSPGYIKLKENVGNYEGAIAKVSPQMAKTTKLLRSSKQGLVAQKIAMQASTVAINVSSTALKFFKIALVSTGIGAIVVVLGTLISYLMTTQSGIDAVTRVTKPLQVIFASLKGAVQELGETMFSTFSNPKEAIIKLWEFIKTNLVNRITAVGGVFKSLEKIISSGFTSGYKDLADSTLQFSTGVEDVTGKIKKLAKDTGKFLGDAVDKGGRLRQIGIDIEQKEAELVLTRAKLKDQVKEQEQIAKNTALSGEQRNKAVDRAIQLTKKLATKEKDIINLKIEQETIEQSLNDSGRADLKKLNELKAESVKKDTEVKEVELRFSRTKSSLMKEFAKKQMKIEEERAEKTIALAKKELAEYINKNQSKIDADKFLTDEATKEEQKRIELLSEKQKDFAAVKLENGKINQTEYNEAIAEIEKEASLKIDEINIERQDAEKVRKAIDFENYIAVKEGQNGSEHEILTQKLEAERQKEIEGAGKTGADIEFINKKYAARQKQIDEISTAQKLNAYANTFGGIAQLLGESTSAGKSAGIAQATINTYQGVTEVWKAPSVLPEPFNTASKVIASGTTLGSGLGAVKKIKTTPTKLSRGDILNGAILEGRSHSEGGIPFSISNVLGFEAEGKEALINKESTAMFTPLLSAINVAGGGKKFAPGGLTGMNSIRSNVALIDYDRLSLKIAEANRKLPAPRVSVTEINEVSNNIEVVEALSTY